MCCASAACPWSCCASRAASSSPSGCATLVKDPSLRVDARAEALIYAAARAQLVEESLLPLLEAGTWVLLDRFVDSSLAYQGGGRGLGVEEVADLNRFAVAGLVPDRTLLLRIDPRTAARGRPAAARRRTAWSAKGRTSSRRSR